MIDAAALRSMRSNAYLSNIARGAIVDEPALSAALREGWIAGAGLDTFCTEPLPPGSPFWWRPAEPPPLTFAQNLLQDTLGIYVQEQVTLAENLKLLLSGRFDLFERSTQNVLTDEIQRGPLRGFGVGAGLFSASAIRRKVHCVAQGSAHWKILKGLNLVLTDLHSSV